LEEGKYTTNNDAYQSKLKTKLANFGATNAIGQAANLSIAVSLRE
jgi:hypothetical protein